MALRFNDLLVSEAVIFLCGLVTVSASVVLGGAIATSLTRRTRTNGSLIGGAAVLGGLLSVGWFLNLPGYHILVSGVLWIGIVIYLLGTGLWIAIKLYGWYHRSEPAIEYGHEDIQVRIVTVGAESVVQASVDALPDSITDRHVIAEQPLDIEGAVVHVVPDGFSCEATRKGRALEWARRTLVCDREFVLYLDEDTIVTPFTGLPDADIVQFGERPYRTGGLVPYLAEMFRIGFQVEQRSFGFLPVPLYAWGGGIAIRASMEERVGWDYDTIIEDTVFVWKAVIEAGAEFATLNTWFYNQSPSTIRSLTTQRRRWIGGGEDELYRLPRRYRAVFKFRNFVWGMTPVASLLPFIILIVPDLVVGRDAYLTVSFLLLLTPLLWVIVGFDYLHEHPLIGALAIPLTPIVTIVHSFGAFIGLLVKPRSFVTTAKTGDGSETRTSLPDGGLSASGQLIYGVRQLANRARIVLTTGLVYTFTPVYRRLGIERSLGVGLPFERKHIRVRPAVLLSGILVVGLAIRLYGLGGASYWFDEIYSVAYRSTLPVNQLIVNEEPHPPLYYLLLKFWMGLFGQGEFAARLLSTVFGVGTMAGTYALCKELFSREAGYIGAMLMAISVFNLHVSQTARMYAPLAFFTVTSIYFMLRVLRGGGYRTGLAFALTALGALFTHLLGAFVALGHNIYVAGVLLVEPDRRWARLKRWVAVELPISVAYFGFILVVMLPQLRAKANGNSKAGWLEPPTGKDIYAGFLSLFGAPVQYPFADYSPAAMATAALIAITATLALIIGTIQYSDHTSRSADPETAWPTVPAMFEFNRDGGRGKILCVVFLGTCFVLPAVASYIVTPMFVPRYLVSAAVIMVVLMTGAVATIQRDALRVVFVVVLLISSISLVGVYQGTDTTEGWKQPVDYVNSQPGAATDESPLVVVQPGWAIPAVNFYGLTDDAHLAGFYQGNYDFGGAGAARTAATQQQAVNDHDTIYLVWQEGIGIEEVDASIRGSHHRIERVQYGDLIVDTYVRDNREDR